MKRKTEIAILAGAALVALGWWFLSSEDCDGGAAEPVRTKSRLIAAAKPRIAEAKATADRAVPDEEPPESAQAPLFEVGGRRFRSLQEAVDAAEPGATVTLEGDAYEEVAEAFAAKDAARLAAKLKELKDEAEDEDAALVRKAFYKTLMSFVREMMLADKLPRHMAFRNIDAVEEAYRRSEKSLNDDAVLSYLLDRMTI